MLLLTELNILGLQKFIEMMPRKCVTKSIKVNYERVTFLGGTDSA